MQVQREIAVAVAGATHVTLLETELPVAKPVDPLAQSYYLQGRYLYNRRQPGDLDAAETAYEQALAADPNHASAMVGLAAIGLVRFDTFDRTVLERINALLDRALELDPRNSEALARKARVLYYTEGFSESVRLVELARALNPDDPLTIATFASLLLRERRMEESLVQLRRLVQVDPLSTVSRAYFATVLLTTGRSSEARDQFLQIFQLAGEDPSSSTRATPASVGLATALVMDDLADEALPQVEIWQPSEERDKLLAILYGKAGRWPESDAAIDRLQSGEGVGVAIQVAEVHAYLGRTELSFQWLQAARQRLMRLSVDDDPRHARLTPYVWSPFLRSIYDDPRWDSTLSSLYAEHEAAFARIFRGEIQTTD